jgi:hypothetical protein
VAVDGDNVPNAAYGTWTSGIGWQSVAQAFSPFHNRLWLRWTGFPIPAAGVTLSLTFTSTGAVPATDFHELDSTLSGTPVQTHALGFSGSSPYTNTFAMDQFDALNFYLSSNSTGSDGDFGLLSMKMCGTGPNPFGDTNCSSCP